MQDTTKKERKIKRRRTKNTGLASAETILPTTLKRLKLGDKFTELEITKNYKEIVGSYIAKHSSVDKLIKGTLHISVTDSARLMQLSSMKDEIIDMINGHYGKNIVKNLNFKVGKVTMYKRKLKESDRIDLRKVILDDKTKALIKESVKGLKDSPLKKSIIAARTAYYKRKQV